MTSYPHVEDYLEIIAGKKSLPGAVAISNYLWQAYAPIINLARYDNSFLDNVTDQTMSGMALTDRQAELAVKLVTKYRRQLHAHNIEVPDMTTPVFRRALRKVDRSKSAGVKDNKIFLKFPYDSKTIDVIRAIAKQSQGSMRFDREDKIWYLALTEYNINWVYEWARQNEFSIDQTLTDLMKEIVAVEQQGYAISLVQQSDQLTINNAHATLLDYLVRKIGSFDLHKRDQLIDHASVCGFTVSDDLLVAAESDLGGSTLLLMTNRDYDFNLSIDMIERIVKYAHTVDRYPIVVFNPTAQQCAQEWTQHFDSTQVQVIANAKDVAIDPSAKLIYTQKALKHMNPIPILVSYVGMMIGADKQLMSGAAEKIFFAAKRLK